VFSSWAFSLICRLSPNRVERSTNMQNNQSRFQIGDRVRVRAQWPGLGQWQGRVVAIDRTIGVRYQVQLTDGARYMYVGPMLERILAERSDSTAA
jgi:hypothetical protein